MKSFSGKEEISFQSLFLFQASFLFLKLALMKGATRSEEGTNDWGVNWFVVSNKSSYELSTVNTALAGMDIKRGDPTQICVCKENESTGKKERWGQWWTDWRTDRQTLHCYLLTIYISTLLASLSGIHALVERQSLSCVARCSLAPIPLLPNLLCCVAVLLIECTGNRCQRVNPFFLSFRRA